MIRSLALASVVAWAAMVSAPAQDSPVAPTPDGAKSTKASYRLQPNDVVELTVFGEPELAKSTRILKTGEAVFPLIGAVHLAGLTLHEATEQIRKLYAADYLRNPKLAVTVLDYAIETVSVVGAVNSPGQVQIPSSGTLDLAAALAAAGDLAPSADTNRITLIRADGRRTTHTRSSIQSNGSIPLAPNDRVVVFESRYLRSSVTILGQVRQPGSVPFPVDGQLDLLKAIGRAGGFSELADKKKVTLSRGEQTTVLDLRDGNEQKAKQFTLRPDDIVTVPERFW